MTTCCDTVISATVEVMESKTEGLLIKYHVKIWHAVSIYYTSYYNHYNFYHEHEKN